jgi:ubiquinol-cytochrome c reductase iron-sulfur subunit
VSDDPPLTDAHQALLARRGERLTALAFGVSIVGALALAVVYWTGGQPQLEGLFLALALGGLGIGLIVWARYFMPRTVDVEERHPVESSEEEIEEFREEFERGEHILTRRSLLVRMGTAAVAALGVALVFPIRSLGPRPGKGFKSTPYHRGVRLVTPEGRLIRAADIAVDGVVTAFPEGHTESADAPTLLIRPNRPVRPRPGREDWTPRNLVAYSKLCTHVGCPVGLYQAGEHLLLCPCHQSTFDVLDGARPVFGPAARALPQLPIEIDDEGVVVARGDFSSPPGPGFWDRDR